MYERYKGSKLVTATAGYHSQSSGLKLKKKRKRLLSRKSSILRATYPFVVKLKWNCVLMLKKKDLFNYIENEWYTNMIYLGADYMSKAKIIQLAYSYNFRQLPHHRFFKRVCSSHSYSFDATVWKKSIFNLLHVCNIGAFIDEHPDMFFFCGCCHPISRTFASLRVTKI